MHDKNNEDLADTDIGLIEIAQFLIDNRPGIAVCTFAGLLLGSLYVVFKPASFEASASIQVAMVSGEPVETAAVLNEKIKLPLYFSTGTLQTCAADGKPSPTGSLTPTFKTQVSKNAPFLNLTVAMPTPALAKNCLMAILTDIQTQQAYLAAPVLAKQRNMLETVKSKLAFSEEISKFLSSQQANINISNEKFSAAAMLLATTTAKDNEIKELRSQLMNLETGLSPTQTKPASLAAPINTPASPVGLDAGLVLLLSAFLGFLLAVMSSLARSAWLRIKPQLKT
jgi:hypothetical protein